MEAAGLTLGVVGLASLFSTCMECFDYIQLSRTFGKDYGKCLLRLHAAKLRFSRWGETTGVASASLVNDRLAVPGEGLSTNIGLIRRYGENIETLSKACCTKQLYK